jgi:cation-transporting ATPase 13A3/4/5
MAGCQSLRHLKAANGEVSLVGDPLEVVMLQSSGWSLHTGGADGTVTARAPSGSVCATQTQVFDFNSEYARMAACVTLTDPRTGALLNDAHRVLVKGSPEAVLRLCLPSSVPADFEAVLARYAGLGYRVLGAAERVLAPSEAAAAAAGGLTREKAEGHGQLRFCGLVVLENQLKPSSAGVIAALQAADMYREIAIEAGITASQLALAWAYSRHFMASVIIGATTVEQLEDNCKASDIELSKETLAKIDAVHAQIRNPNLRN